MRNCIVEECTNEAICKKLCNAHYLRIKKGKDLTKPIQLKNRVGCTVEHCTNIHEGRGLCKNHLRQQNRDERWNEIIISKGGCCEECGQEVHRACYELHHLDPSKKDFSIGNEIVNKSMEELIKEAQKCKLVCANCHRIIHYKIDRYG